MNYFSQKKTVDSAYAALKELIIYQFCFTLSQRIFPLEKVNPSVLAVAFKIKWPFMDLELCDPLRKDACLSLAFPMYFKYFPVSGLLLPLAVS